MKFKIAKDQQIIAWTRAIYEVEADNLNNAIDMVLTDTDSKGSILESTKTIIPDSVEVYEISGNE